jgi:hypothetical protein
MGLKKNPKKHYILRLEGVDFDLTHSKGYVLITIILGNYAPKISQDKGL